MAELKWVLEDNGKVLRADVENMGVVLTVTPVDRPDEKINRTAEVFTTLIGWPPSWNKFMMTGWHEMCTLEDIKKRSLLAFVTWARSVITIATSDGYGNITIDLGDDNEW